MKFTAPQAPSQGQTTGATPSVRRWQRPRQVAGNATSPSNNALRLPAPDDGEPMIEINTTPLIDVMLVLLVMLIITIPLQLNAVNLQLPKAGAQATTEKPVVIQLVIDANHQVTWNGEAVPSTAALQDLMDQAQRQAQAHGQPQPEIRIRAHDAASYETVTTVLSAAQRAGLQKIGIASSTP